MTERERLVKLLRAANNCHTLSNCDVCVECEVCNNYRIADYLLKNGVIVPPCNVGDTVYVDNRCINSLFIDRGIYFIHDKVSRCDVLSISRTRKQLLIKIAPVEAQRRNSRYHLRVPVSAFGKTVFLTKEEAEKALKERGGN